MTNPFGYPPRPANPKEFGVGHSGPKTIVNVGDIKQILNISVAEIVPQGYYGMATVHITVRDETLNPDEDGNANDRLIGRLHWQSGNSGGEEDLDLTRGRILAVGATTSLVIDNVRLVPANDQPLVIWSSKSVEVTVCWYTSISPKHARVTDTAFLLAAPGFASPFFPIPLQAEFMTALGFPVTAYPTLIAEFSTNNVVGGNGLRYSVLNPFGTPTSRVPIVQGVNFVRFTNTVAMEVFPVFDLLT